MGRVVVKKYKGERALQSGIRSMARRGYVVQSQTTRKKWFSLSMGIFTRKQVHTVTFTKA